MFIEHFTAYKLLEKRIAELVSEVADLKEQLSHKDEEVSRRFETSFNEMSKILNGIISTQSEQYKDELEKTVTTFKNLLQQERAEKRELLAKLLVALGAPSLQDQIPPQNNFIQQEFDPNDWREERMRTMASVVMKGMQEEQDEYNKFRASQAEEVAKLQKEQRENKGSTTLMDVPQE